MRRRSLRIQFHAQKYTKAEAHCPRRAVNSALCAVLESSDNNFTSTGRVHKHRPRKRSRQDGVIDDFLQHLRSSSSVIIDSAIAYTGEECVHGRAKTFTPAARRSLLMNVIGNGDASMPLGIEGNSDACTPDNLIGKEGHLRNDNAINALRPQFWRTQRTTTSIPLAIGCRTQPGLKSPILCGS